MLNNISNFMAYGVKSGLNPRFGIKVQAYSSSSAMSLHYHGAGLLSLFPFIVLLRTVNMQSRTLSNYRNRNLTFIKSKELPKFPVPPCNPSPC